MRVEHNTTAVATSTDTQIRLQRQRAYCTVACKLVILVTSVGSFESACGHRLHGNRTQVLS